MRRILTIRTSVNSLPETIKPYTGNSHRIVYAIQGSIAVVAIYRSLISKSSLQSVTRCDELYVPPELSALRVPSVLPALRTSYIAIVDGIPQTVDTSKYRVDWRKSNAHYYGYRSKLDNVVVG